MVARGARGGKETEVLVGRLKVRLEKVPRFFCRILVPPLTTGRVKRPVFATLLYTIHRMVGTNLGPLRPGQRRHHPQSEERGPQWM
jgi:hypothetical protein